ncbi:MAG TPA: protease inhibitor I42 family protein [Methanoregula sp.]|nr:protease inhibitor I42 family protein [Methanoregula sp.]
MNTTTIITVIGIICCLAVAAAGCLGTGQGTPATPPEQQPSGTPVQVGHLFVNESQNNATVSISKGEIITVSLAENPTTGYQWNLTVTPGLNITADTYTPSDPTGRLVGSGGTHSWDITAIASGDQQISAVYRRSWEPVTGNESAFVMTVTVR